MTTLQSMFVALVARTDDRSMQWESIGYDGKTGKVLGWMAERHGFKYIVSLPGAWLRISSPRWAGEREHRLDARLVDAILEFTRVEPVVSADDVLTVICGNLQSDAERE